MLYSSIIKSGGLMANWCFPLIILAVALCATFAWPAQEEKKATRQVRDCLQCHTHQETIIRGLLEEVSESEKTISLATYAGDVRTVKYDENTVVKGWLGSIPGLPRDRGISIAVREKNGEAYAETISVRQPKKERGRLR